MIDTEGRHPGTAQVARWFDYSHLSGPARDTAAAVHDLAAEVVDTLPDGPELTAGLRKLLEAKDCFVRATIAKENP